MKTFNQVVSTIIRVSLIFLLYFIWTRYYINSLIWAIILSSALTLITDWLLINLSKRKDLKASLKKEELARAEGYCNNFIFNNKSEAVNFYFKLLNKEFSPVKKSDYIIFEKDNKRIVLFPYYKFNKVIVEDIIFVYNKIKNIKCDRVILCINDIAEPVKRIAMKLPIEFVILNKYEAYEKFMKKYEIYPELFNFDDNQKFTFKNLMEISLNKRKARGYIFASIILFISSFFVRVTVYYLIMSTILLLLSIFSYINPIYNKKYSDAIL